MIGFLAAALLLLQIREDELGFADVVTLVVTGDNVGELDLIDVVVPNIGSTVQKLGEAEAVIEAPDKELRIFAVGDVMLGRYVRTLMNENGMDYVFSALPEWFELTAEADVVHGNLEGPIFGEGRSGGTAMRFAFNRDIGPFLAKYGFDLVSIANNHALDMGWDGRAETIEVLDQSAVGWCGHPTETPRDSVYFGESEAGVTYAFVCMHDVGFGLDKDEAVNLLSELDSEVDYLIVSIHWGSEYQQRATGWLQVDPAHRFVDAGADLVIGHHPHVVQNFEIYNGVPIFYSLGNFIFDQYWAIMVQEEMAIDVLLKEDGYEIELIPMKSEKSKSRLMNEEEKKEWLEEYIWYGNYDEELQEMIKNGKVVVE